MKPSSATEPGTMGDMKTPDFDDLLAAFDIPDMVDPKSAIESGPSDDHEGPLKQASTGRVAPGEDGLITGQDIGVSVIVKNIRSTLDTGEQDGSPLEGIRKLSNPHHAHSAVANGVHNGLLAATSSTNLISKTGWRVPINRAPAGTTSAFHQFSPVSSAEEFEDDDKIELDEPMMTGHSQSLLRPIPITSTVHPSCPKKEEQKRLLRTLVDIDSKIRVGRHIGQAKAKAGNKIGPLKYAKQGDTSKAKPDVQPKQETTKPQDQEDKEPVEPSGSCSDPDQSVSQAKAKTSAKLSSCIAAIAALSAKKFSSKPPRVSDRPAIQKESIPVIPHGESHKVAKESPGPHDPQPEQESALEVAKRLLSREPDSPCSVNSECSSKESPTSPTGTTPVIPKVRIKTIKTSSGQIKRTVTRVLPEFGAEGKGGEESNSMSLMVCSALSPITSNTLPPSHPHAVIASRPSELTRHMTIKPVATAFLPISAVNKAGSQVINLKLANNTTVKATVIPASSVQSASNAIRRAANGTQPQTVMVHNCNLANAKLLPKTVHLTNLNLLPKAASNTTCEIQQTAPSNKTKQQQVKQQATRAGRLPKKVSRVQLFSSTQGTVVEAFNKVLSSINPVPSYVPDLSPPTGACISLPSCGYKCLECGDSFALDKSLSQHFERRSVRIEVTCNHCAKSLVFYNKCSLLSHARGHKDKGVVMQCSHLILKPIPTDQMITTSAPISPRVTSSATVSTTQAQSCTPIAAQAKATAGGAQSSVISAPIGTPIMAAMPLEEDGTKQCRQSLKCMECNEMFQDESSLVIHYQHAAEFNAQKTCSICQMLLPNHCSFVSHQRIHQHKSPYICPECGTSCRSAHFQSHVTRNCLHYTRRVGYRCVHCNVIFGDVSALKSHIQNTHCEVFYKCAMCPMAFKSAQAMHSHGYTQHPGAKIGEPKLIYKCSMCDTVFTLQSLLNAHFDQHVGNQKVSVFKCPDCSMLYAQKQLMLDHIKITHGSLKIVEGPPNLGSNLPLSTKPTHTNSNNNNSNKDGGHANFQDKKPCPLSLKTTNGNCISGDRGPQGPQVYTCGECDGVFTSREVFVSHMRRDHGKILKKHPCCQCDKSFSSSHSLCRHTRLKHKGLRKIYTCPHCPPLSQPFTKRVLLDQHIQLTHNVKESELKGQELDEVDSHPNKPQIAGFKRKTAEEGDTDVERSPCLQHRRPGSPQLPPAKKPKMQGPKALKCAVCGFSCGPDEAAFRLHVPQHKSDGSSHQCQECGLCYTSRRSLARHLFIIHRMKDHQNLARRNRAGPASASAGALDEGDASGDEWGRRESPSEVADENDGSQAGTRCKVCRKVFDTEGHLNSHMRTHGMAFIKAKRLSAAEK